MQRKVYRLLKPSLFALTGKRLYLAFETQNGYRMKIDGNQWIGLPKFCVEKGSILFRLYNKDDHNQAKRDNFNNHKTNNYVSRTRDLPYYRRKKPNISGQGE